MFKGDDNMEAAVGKLNTKRNKCHFKVHSVITILQHPYLHFALLCKCIVNTFFILALEQYSHIQLVSFSPDVLGLRNPNESINEVLMKVLMKVILHLTLYWVSQNFSPGFKKLYNWVNLMLYVGISI